MDFMCHFSPCSKQLHNCIIKVVHIYTSKNHTRIPLENNSVCKIEDVCQFTHLLQWRARTGITLETNTGTPTSALSRTKENLTLKHGLHFYPDFTSAVFPLWGVLFLFSSHPTPAHPLRPSVLNPHCAIHCLLPSFDLESFCTSS